MATTKKSTSVKKIKDQTPGGRVIGKDTSIIKRVATKSKTPTTVLIGVRELEEYVKTWKLYKEQLAELNGLKPHVKQLEEKLQESKRDFTTLEKLYEQISDKNQEKLSQIAELQKNQVPVLDTPEQVADYINTIIDERDMIDMVKIVNTLCINMHNSIVEEAEIAKQRVNEISDALLLLKQNAEQITNQYK